MDLQKQLDLFHATPPRLFPHQPEQRAMIDRLLAQVAAADKDQYEELFERYNRFCDQLQVPRFGRVTVIREVEPTPELPKEEVPVVEQVISEVSEEAPAEPVVELPVEPKPAKKRRKHSSPSAQ